MIVIEIHGYVEPHTSFAVPTSVRVYAMCFPFDAIVPDLPPGLAVIAGGAAGERHTLTSADGTEFSAYLARAEGPTGVVVLPDIRGLFRFYEELAERFAAAGHPAIAIDYFGRTAGLGPRDEDFEFRPHVEQSTPEHVALDVAAAIEALGTERVVTVGFCFGGSMSFLQATEGHSHLAGAVGFYGGLAKRGVIERAPARRCRCSACSAATTSRSRPNRSRRSTRPCRSSTRSRSTRARRTPSSTGAPSSTPTSPRTRGSASWDSSPKLES